MRQTLFAILVLSAPATAAKLKAPDGAPYCALQNTRPLFVSPMGEPFRGEPGKPYPSATWFAAADRNHDGAVDRAEMIADADRFFRTIDLNHDGRLTPEEIGRYESVVAPETALFEPRGRGMMPPDRQSRRAGESGYGGPMGAGRYSWLNIPAPVASADADVDRIVTAQEFAASAGRRFELLDPDGRGRLTLADLPKTPAQQAIEGPCKQRPKPRKPSNREPLRFDDPRDEDGPAPNGRERTPQ
jgi:hypothetical protein